MSAPTLLAPLKVALVMGTCGKCPHFQRYGLSTLPTHLQDICIKVVASNFEQNPTFGSLPEKYARKVTDGLPLDLPLELVGTVRYCVKCCASRQQYVSASELSLYLTCYPCLQLIADENYWKRRANARWKNCEVGRLNLCI